MIKNTLRTIIIGLSALSFSVDAQETYQETDSLKQTNNDSELFTKGIGFYINDYGYKTYELEKLEHKPFIDTKKPNAIITIPTYDPKDAFRSEANKDLIDSIAVHYDINFAVLKDEQGLYNTIGETPEPELLMIGGHGDWTRVMFDDKRKLQGRNQEVAVLGPGTSMKTFATARKELKKRIQQMEEKLELSNLDIELREQFKKLSPTATIYLQSCEGGKYNLVDNIKRFALPTQTVMAGIGSYGAENIEVTNMFPFRITIHDAIYTPGGNNSPNGVYLK